MIAQIFNFVSSDTEAFLAIAALAILVGFAAWYVWRTEL
jgi:ABC-type nickel/cobalt efflux system permease component RcnA